MSFFREFGFSTLSDNTASMFSDEPAMMILEKDTVNESELRNVIVENRLNKYSKNFARMKITYSDLHELSEEQMNKLIPDNIPRMRFEKFIKRNFIQKEGSEGWEIESETVKIDSESHIATGAYGSIKLAEIDFGYRKLKIACKEIRIDGKIVTKEVVVNELRIMSMCHSPYVLKCYGGFFSPDEKVATICMEFLPEGDLLKFAEKNKKNVVDWNPYSKLRILIDIARGLVYLHKKGIVHRDIKPHNILIVGDRAKLCDFGQSKLVNKVSGTVVGTPAYIPPESFHSRTLENPLAMDIYSFGILSWQIFTDDLPYAHLRKKYPKDPLRFLIAIHGKPGRKKKGLQVRPNMSHEKLKGLESEIFDIMECCWEDEVAHRPNAEKVLRELIFIEKGMRKKYREDEEEEEIDW